jgi:hypothetical protein
MCSVASRDRRGAGKGPPRVGRLPEKALRVSADCRESLGNLSKKKSFIIYIKYLKNEPK